MLDPKHPLAELLRRDGRYHFDSYVFIFDSLRYAQEKLNMGRVTASSPHRDEPRQEESESSDASFLDEDFKDEDDDFDDEFDEDFDDDDFSEEELADEAERHITGQDLCEAIRQYALNQYGLLARSVFNHWGIHSTGDFGEIVFNLIDIGQMRKTENDRREDFENVFDFDEALSDGAVFSGSGITPRKGSARKGDEE